MRLGVFAGVYITKPIYDSPDNDAIAPLTCSEPQTSKIRILRELLDESGITYSFLNPMKLNGYGQARILTSSEIDKLFAWGFTNSRDRALFGICLHTGCRISEALAITTKDLQGGYITLRKLVTKGKRRTRMIPINDPLQGLLGAYLRECKPKSFLFPGSHNAKTSKQMTRAAADLILKDACSRLGLVGVSTHSFRRTALTQMHNAGIPLRVIQMISGHSSLETLQRYLEVTDEQIVEAVNAICSKTNRKNEDRA